jgi:hypothetical protein
MNQSKERDALRSVRTAMVTALFDSPEKHSILAVTGQLSRQGLH